MFWLCVYSRCGFLEAVWNRKKKKKIRLEELNVQFLSVLTLGCWTKGCDAGGWGHDCIGYPLTFTASTLPWSVAEISQIWEQESFVTEVESDRGGEDEGQKRTAAGAVSVWVWEKSWHELHLSVVIEKISTAWFSDVQKWTELPQLTEFWYISQVSE